MLGQRFGSRCLYMSRGIGEESSNSQDLYQFDLSLLQMESWGSWGSNLSQTFNELILPKHHREGPLNPPKLGG
jgi:hypothetical protein